MPLPPQVARHAQEVTTPRTLIAYDKAWRRRQAGVPDVIVEPDPDTGEPKEWIKRDKGDYWEITDPDGVTYKVNKEQNLGQSIEDMLDDHLTWGNLFKLGLVGLGGAIFLGGIKMTKEVSNGKK